VDWSIDVDGLRGALRELVEETPLWDGRVAVAQVVDAVGGEVSVRALVSARDAGTLWDLRCLVREGLVKWVRGQRCAAPHAVPRCGPICRS